MKVIAIKDAPIPERGYTHKVKHYERDYYKGDVFEIYDAPMFRTEDYLIIYHDKLEITMDVDPKNFITLREHREVKLKELGI
jgi:hypothetical protein